MKTLFSVILVSTYLSAAYGSELPKEFHGRWFCDEAATAKEWAVRAKTDTERRVAEAMPRMQSETKKRFGKPMLAYLDITGRDIVAGESALNPRFEIMSVTEKLGEHWLEARFFQVPDDDNPRVEHLVLGNRDSFLVLELRDEEGRITWLYVLKKKEPNQASEPTAASGRGSL